MAVLPQPPTPYNPTDPSSVIEWNNYFLSLASLQGSQAPADAQFLVATANSSLTNERNLGALSTGFLVITVAAGIAVPASTLSGSSLTNLNASQLASGTVPDARFPSTLPALNGSALTNLNATALASGTVPQARFPAATAWTPAIAGTSGSGITYTTQTGSIVKHGPMVIASFEIVLSALGTAAGAVSLTGLTYTVENVTNLWQGHVVEWAALTTPITRSTLLLVHNTTTGAFTKLTVAAVSSFAALTIADLSATSILRGTLTYSTSD